LSGIDKYAYQSKLARVNAGTKLLFTLASMAVCLSFSSVLVSTLTIAVMSAATLILGGCRLRCYIRLLMIPFAFLVTGTITIIVGRISQPTQALVSIPLLGARYGVSADSLKTGVIIFLRAFGAVTCLYFFSLNTPMNSLLSLLRRKTPGLFVELMELCYRFIFVVWEEAGKIHTAQASRLGYDGFMRSLHSMGDLVTNVFLRVFRRVDRVTAALESRGFEGNFELLAEQEESSRLLEGLAIAATMFLIIIGLLERLLT
jgi:cobalt/nickel transport system permease protein